MKIGAIPETVLEWLALKLELAPRALVDTHGAMLLARTIMAGAELKVFDALSDRPLTAEETATACGAATAPIALKTGNTISFLSVRTSLRLWNTKFHVMKKA